MSGLLFVEEVPGTTEARALCLRRPRRATVSPEAMAASRRGVLGAATGLLAFGGLGVAHGAASAPGGPDEELIAVCARLDALERLIDAMNDPQDPAYVEDDAARDEAVEHIQAAQAPLVERICTARASTPEGNRARVRSFLLWDKERDPARDAMQADRPWGGRMLAAVLRDALGVTAVTDL